VIAPSGEQHVVALGGQRAVVVEVGAGLRSYLADGREIVDGYDAGELAPSGRGQVLLPWPNRIGEGAYEWDGARYQLSISEPARQDAIHGLVRWAAWRVREREPHRVVLEHVLHAQPGYPFTLELSVEYALSGDGLLVRTTATNAGAAACPFGGGNHPYLAVAGGSVDEAVLRVPAARVLVEDDRGLPVGTAGVEEAGLDFRSPRPVGATVLDHPFTDLERDPDGLARVVLREPGGAATTLWVDGAYRYLMLFTGDPLPDVARRCLAVEPMTCPPDAFRTGEAVVRLEPGATWTGSWGIVPGEG
jgi:aldose 1-epimerase